MKHGSLFNGIGGFQIAAGWMGWENVMSCEIDKFCNKITKYHFPNCIQHEDIRTTNFSRYNGQIEILTGGFPCQKFSQSGSQTGDETFIIEMLRSVAEINPRWVVAENVGNILNKKFKHYLDILISGLEDKGYETPIIFDSSADAFGLSTMERHIWFISESHSQRQEREFVQAFPDKPVFPRKLPRNYQGEIDRWSVPENRVCGMGQGVSGRLDIKAIRKSKWHSESLKALGNAIPPQVAYEIFRSIEQYELTNTNS